MVVMGELELVVVCEVFGLGVEWLKWMLEDEFIVKCWMENIIVVD